MNDDRETLERALTMARRALAHLEEQAAGYTALTIPTHLQLELEEKRRQVAALERRCAEPRQEKAPSSPSPPSIGDTASDAAPTSRLPQAQLLHDDKPQVASNQREGAGPTLTWLHLSDLHFRESRAYDENIVLQALLRDVTERIRDDGLRPDFAVITGDLAFSGKPAEYALATRFLDELLKTTGLSRQQLFLVPGNHDVDRSRITGGAQAITDALVDRASANTCLKTAADRRLVLARFKGYARFTRDYYGGKRTFSDRQYFYVHTFPAGGRQAAVLGLNSACVCASDADKTPGVLLGERQVRDALTKAKGADLRIALLHHPFDWLRDFDRADSEALLLDACHFVLHGHLHRTAALQLVGPDAQAMVIAGGACYETRDYPNAYNFVRLDFAAGKGQILLRRYSDASGGFWARDTLTYRNAPDGVYTFDLPPSDPHPGAPPPAAPFTPSAGNPFTVGPAIRDPARFYGRQAELQAIAGRVGGVSAQSISIVGERRIGKSSLLWQVKARAADLFHTGHRYVVLYQDLTGAASRSNHDLMRTLRRDLTRAGLPAWGAAEDGDLSALSCVLEDLESHHPDVRLVLLLDEFECVSERPAEFDGLLGELRAEGQLGRVALVTASATPLADLCAQGRLEPSPFFNIFTQVTLGPLDEAAWRALVQDGLGEVGADDWRLIEECAGRHPFYTQMAASLLWEARRAGPVDYGALQAQFEAQAQQHRNYQKRHAVTPKS
jgi:3',5'-cyclic AMP phosphodiesterase CpdA